MIYCIHCGDQFHPVENSALTFCSWDCEEWYWFAVQLNDPPTL